MVILQTFGENLNYLRSLVFKLNEKNKTNDKTLKWVDFFQAIVIALRNFSNLIVYFLHIFLDKNFYTR